FTYTTLFRSASTLFGVEQCHECSGGVGQGSFGMNDVAELALKRHTRYRQAYQLIIEHGAWQHTPGDTDGNHHLDRFQIVGAHADIRLQFFAFEQALGDMVGKGVVAGKNRWIGGYVGQCDFCHLRQGMFGCYDEIQRVVPDPDGSHGWSGVGGKGDDCQLGTAMEHIFVSDFRVEKADIQRHFRMRAGKGAQQGRQAVQADVMAGGQAQATADVAVEVGQGAPGIVQYAENLVGTR